MNLAKQELKIITKLRGIASLLVFLFHLICLSGGYITTKWFVDIFRYGKYGVHVFFVISGYIIIYSLIISGYKLNNFFTFLKKRIIRIEPPYIFIVFLTILFLFLRYKMEMKNSELDSLPGWKQILFHIGYLIPFSNYEWLSIVFWTLAVEFQFYVILSLIVNLFVKNVIARICICIGFLCFSYFSLYDNHFLFWSPVFMVGIFLALYNLKRIKIQEFAVASCILFIFISLKFEWEIFVFTILPFLIIWWNPIIKSKILDFFGKISYSLYLCHTLICFTIINIGIRYGQTFFLKLVFVNIAFWATIFFSYLMYRYLEKPFKKMASSIKYKNE